MAYVAKLFHTSEQHVDSLLNQGLQSPHARHAEKWRQRGAPIPVEIVLYSSEQAKVHPQEFGLEGVFIGFAKCGSRYVNRAIKVLSWPVSSLHCAGSEFCDPSTHGIMNVYFPRGNTDDGTILLV